MSGVRRDVQLTPADLDLKAGYSDLVAAVGGDKRAEAYSRPDQRRHSDYQNPRVESQAPIDAVAALERRAVGTAGFPQVTRILCRNAGGTFVPLPSVNLDGQELSTAIAAHAKESGEATARACTLIGTRPTKSDWRDALREMDEAGEAWAHARALIARQAGEA